MTTQYRIRVLKAFRRDYGPLTDEQMKLIGNALTSMEESGIAVFGELSETGSHPRKAAKCAQCLAAGIISVAINVGIDAHKIITQSANGSEPAMTA
jgi:hypothetical protein